MKMTQMAQQQQGFLWLLMVYNTLQVYYYCYKVKGQSPSLTPWVKGPNDFNFITSGYEGEWFQVTGE